MAVKGINMTTDIIILAAGKGSRMKSKLPKVLQPLAGKTLVQHVIDSARELSDTQLHLVVGHEAEQVKNSIDDDVLWYEQTEQLGTGHAVMQVENGISDEGTSLVLYGDVPLIKPETLQALVAKVDQQTMSLLTIVLDNPTGYGRIIRENDKVVAIVEEKDASETEKQVKETNTGILAIDNRLLKTLLPKIGNDNAQQEYYLTDLISLANDQGATVEAIVLEDEIEVQGVNDKRQLQDLERAYQRRLADELMVQGATLFDATRLDIRGQVKIGQDVEIEPNVQLLGDVILGDNVQIGANCIIGTIGKKTEIGSATEIKANSIIEEGIIGKYCQIGPYARIRPGTQISNNAKIGNFVETKKAMIGEGSKVNHLTYIGDSLIGKNVNVGAGTITCNYDGVNKFQTIIEDEAFIGSNSSLVAPVKIGKTATIAAGSTITKDVEEKDLALARGKQKNLQGWARPTKKK